MLTCAKRKRYYLHFCTPHIFIFQESVHTLCLLFHMEKYSRLTALTRFRRVCRPSRPAGQLLGETLPELATHCVTRPGRGNSDKAKGFGQMTYLPFGQTTKFKFDLQGCSLHCEYFFENTITPSFRYGII